MINYNSLCKPATELFNYTIQIFLFLLQFIALPLALPADLLMFAKTITTLLKLQLDCVYILLQPGTSDGTTGTIRFSTAWTKYTHALGLYATNCRLMHGSHVETLFELFEELALTLLECRCSYLIVVKLLLQFSNLAT